MLSDSEEDASNKKYFAFLHIWVLNFLFLRFIKKVDTGLGSLGLEFGRIDSLWVQNLGLLGFEVRLWLMVNSIL